TPSRGQASATRTRRGSMRVASTIASLPLLLRCCRGRKSGRTSKKEASATSVPAPGRVSNTDVDSAVVHRARRARRAAAPRSLVALGARRRGARAGLGATADEALELVQRLAHVDRQALQVGDRVTGAGEAEVQRPGVAHARDVE